MYLSETKRNETKQIHFEAQTRKLMGSPRTLPASASEPTSSKAKEQKPQKHTAPIRFTHLIESGAGNEERGRELQTLRTRNNRRNRSVSFARPLAICSRESSNSFPEETQSCRLGAQGDARQLIESEARSRACRLHLREREREAQCT